MAERKYKSKRLEGLKGKWTDAEVLLYIANKVDFRTSHPDLKEALDKRIEKIIAKITVSDIANLDVKAILKHVKDSLDKTKGE